MVPRIRLANPTRVLVTIWCLWHMTVPGRALADGSFSAIGAGGLTLVNERRVSIEQERLRLGPEQIEVEYVVRNTSDEPVRGEVAFPIPDYDYSPNGYRDFREFSVFVSGVRVPVEAEVRAIIRTPGGEKDISSLLRSYGINVERFARVDEPSEVSERGETLRSRNQLLALPLEKLQALTDLGAVESQGLRRPQWKNRAVFHWVQHFPANQRFKIAIAYKPAFGSELLHGAAQARFKESCADATVQRLAHDRKDVTWVKFNLTDTKSWKMPIGRFEIVVDVPKRAVASFCWEGQVEKSNGTLRATATDLVPAHELIVYYFFE